MFFTPKKMIVIKIILNQSFEEKIVENYIINQSFERIELTFIKLHYQPD
jgi:hypothetical protein